MPLKIHFLNVGHGDCTFIELPAAGLLGERLMMVDINNCKSLTDEEVKPPGGITVEQLTKIIRASLDGKSFEDYYRSLLVDPYDYYRDILQAKYDHIFRYIQTHPDMDHMSGLHRFFWEEGVPLINFWDIAHAKAKTEEEFEGSRYSYLDWAVYQNLRNGIGPNGQNNNFVIIRHRLANGDHWTGDSIELLSPTPELLQICNDNGSSWNNASYVLRITYGGRSVILAGDAEGPAWDSMLEEVQHLLPCDILKAAHHGRESGHHADALDVMDPHYVICSVGNKSEIPDASPLYKKQGATVYSTRAYGTITATIWHDGEIWIEAGGERISTLPAKTSVLAALGLQ